MPLSSRSRDRATACANTPPSSRKTYTPMPPSTRPNQNAAAVLRNNQSVSNMPDYQPHTIRRTAEYSAPTFKENSAPFDTTGLFDINAQPVYGQYAIVFC